MDPWLAYEQSTGRLLNPDGSLLAQCYSGLGSDKNNPKSQAKGGQGPIPQGMYTLVDVENVKVSGPHGKYVIRLTPDKANEMFGRDGFLIHGDGISDPGAASHGCIVTLHGATEKVLAQPVREAIWSQPVRRLKVVA